MKSYYCFVPSEGKLTPESKVFKVAVGVSERDQIKLRLVSLYAVDADLFFRIWDSSTDFELDCMTDDRFRDLLLVGRGFKVVVVSISQLYRAIVDGSVDSLDNPPHVAKNFFLMSSTLSPRFYFKNKISKLKRGCAPLTRKNLSGGDVPSVLNALIGFIILVILYWVGALVEAIEKGWY